MNLLIVGGSGHVSGAIARAALRRNWQVRAITRGKRPLPEGVKGLVAERHDHGAMEAVIAGEKTEWDLVVDCICMTRDDMLQDIELFRRRAKKFVFVSTDFVFDPARRRFLQPVDGPFCAEEASPYGWRKRRCEEELLNGDTGEMAWTVFRPCHIYGPTSELGCLPLHGRDPKLIESLRDGKPVRLVGGGHFLQQPILADDLAETIVSVAGSSDAGSRIFNMAGPDVIESREYYRIVADILGVELRVEEVPVGEYLSKHPAKATFICHRVYDLAPLEAARLSVPSTPIQEGLRLHVEGLLEARK